MSQSPHDQRDFILDLEKALQKPLPGLPAQLEMAPEIRPRSIEGEYRPAAVLIALFPTNDEWEFPLIRRIEDNYPHSGQIALPGGAMEPGENPPQTAEREAVEEVGLPQDSIHILGQLTPLPIPISRYLVYPVVGYLEEPPPRFVLQTSEVESVFTVTLTELCDPLKRKIEYRKLGNNIRRIPYFDFNGGRVWGATAMILSEFKAIITQNRIVFQP